MKSRPHYLIIASLLVLTGVGCSSKKGNGLGRDGYLGGPGGAGVQRVLRSVRCTQGLGPGRTVSRLRTGGAYHNGYTGRLTPGQIPGTITGTYVGVSGGGDIMEVRSMSNGRAEIFLHICTQPGLIMPGRQVVQADINPGRIITKARTDCVANEVTSANLFVYLGPYQYLPGATFPLRFFRFQDMDPSLCHRGGFPGAPGPGIYRP